MRLLKTVPSSQSEHDLPESKLWFAVIVQALTDAAYAGNRREPLYNKREAIQWMKNEGNDFKMVFHYAGYEFDYATRKVRKLLSSIEYQLNKTQLAILTKKKFTPRVRTDIRYKLSF
tara:strand:+ start:1960 stop:2310 length:351 start_codon:yes stop_codon:yes gene_type:complete